MRSKLPDSITNEKLVKLYEAVIAELDLITLESAYPYVVNDALNSPTPEVVPFMARDMNINQLEYSLASENEEAGSFALRRDLIKNSFRLHQRKGTVGIIEEIFEKTGRTDGKLLEWWEYGASAFRFMVELNTPLPRKESDMLFGLIKRYKRAVAKLDVKYKTNLGVKKTYAAVVRNDRVIKYAVEFGAPFPLDLSALYFSDAGYSADGKEILSRMGAPTSAIISSRYVAEGDGVSAKLYYNKKDLGLRDYELECEANIADITAAGGICGNNYWGSGVRIGIFIYSSNLYAMFDPNVSGYSNVIVPFSSLGVSNNEWHKYALFADRDDKIHLYVDDVEVGTAVDISGSVAVNMLFRQPFRILGDQINAVDAQIKNVKCKWGGVDTFIYPLEGSTHDTSGNGYHLTNNGVDLLAVHSDFTNKVYSHNLKEGFDLYFDDATGLIPYYVPYLNGSPVVSSVANYTLDSSHPALVHGHNMAPVDVSFSSDLDDDLMNKSRTDVWKNGAREFEYDPTRPNDWSEKTLTPEFIAANIQDAYKNRIFMAVERNASGDVVRLKNLCIYKRSLSTAEAGTVEAWLESSVFTEKGE